MVTRTGRLHVTRSTTRTSLRCPAPFPTDAEARLPKAPDDRPARSSVRGRACRPSLLVVAFIANDAAGWSPSSSSIGVSAAFGLKYSIYGVAWRRIAKTLALPQVEPEHEYPPRFAQVLGSVALILSLVAFAVGADDPRLGASPSRWPGCRRSWPRPATASAAGSTSCAGGSRIS